MNRFFERYQDRPGKNTLYGYDTMSLLLDLIQSGASQRSTLAKALEQVRDFRGYHSRIGFSPGRVNFWLSILRFDGERIIPVEEMAVQ
jgi:ABC-type branched-subunit amino acid transport system substrate-binding protein